MGIAPSFGIDPWQRLRGWQAVGDEVAERLAEMPNAVLTADERSVIAELLFYVPPQPPDWVKLRQQALAQDHYELVSDPSAIGERPVLYVTRSGSADRLADRFETVEEQLPIERQRPTRGPETYHVFLLQGFKGD